MAIYTIYNEYQSPPSGETQVYGCALPDTKSTVTDCRINGGAHDVPYSYVRFEADKNTSTVLMRITASTDADIHDITFDHCVFATMNPARQGDNFHMLNYSLTGKVVYNITFTNCWFEPNSRMSLEMNGRGGWWHDVTIDHCTFEGGLGEILSFDMSPGDYTPTSPYGVNVGGVVRGVESLVVTNNLIEGTGVPSVGTYTQPNPGGSFYSWRKGIELGCVYPYSANTSVGRSEFSRNKVGRCLDSWYQTNYSGASYLTFEDNIFDDAYNDHACPVRPTTVPAFSGVSASHSAFAGNEYRLGSPHSSIFVSGYSGTANTYSGDRWYSDRSSIDANLNLITSSTYQDCDFYLPSVVKLGSGCTYDTACYFEHGQTGGTPA